MIKIVPTALCSHGSCFICREKHRSLFKITKHDIIYAYKNYRIYIKNHARVCDAHYDENRLIRKEEFSIIPFRYLPLSVDMIKMYEMLSATTTSIFDQFSEMKYLSNDHCKKVTGWSKDEFIRFAQCISSINESKNRTKEQLIALYRYWLRTGIDQNSLASLFNNDTSQTEISQYLDQIRMAINKDFVLHFLGAKKSREYYLNFNTVMTHNLHSLNADVLVVLADGTYCRIEKSKNNDFQYKTYSVQKSTSLYKPFIICCADGYIIDCYGPFQANANDATLLNYIIESDQDLKKILLPYKTMIILDRGFRDSKDFLIKKHLNPKIPTCSQEESREDSVDKQLTVKQTSESRLVTKCRFIVEKKIGEIKKYLALDNRRNVEMGHLQIDYRIACAMLNFFHRPCCADERKAEKISSRMKKKVSNPKSNDLECLAKLRFGTKAIPYSSVSEIIDFPKLSRATLVRKLFFGNSYINLCKSYLPDLLKNGTFSSINYDCLKSLSSVNRAKLSEQMQSSKIIGIEVSSRHKRSLKNMKAVDSKHEIYIKKFRINYKVFIQYLPNINSSKSIKSYICSCKSGRKQVGCCIHVATLIYYLCYAKYRDYALKSPGEYLNTVLVDLTKHELPNKPRNIRYKRLKRNDISTSSSGESSGSDNGESSAPDNGESSASDNGESSESEKGEISGLMNDLEVNNGNKELITDQNVINSNISLAEFRAHVPKWSARINYQGSDNVLVTNTCTIDYFLFALWILHKKDIQFFGSLPESQTTDTIKMIIDYIDKLNWNKARELWIVNVMNYNVSPSKNSISMYGSEYLRFLQYMVIYQTHNLIEKCDINCVNTNSVNQLNQKELTFNKTVNKRIELYSFRKKKCKKCLTDITIEIQFLRKPNVLFIESNGNIKIDEIPEVITVDNSNYHLFCTTLFKRNHFIGVFDLNDMKYVIDDLSQSVTPLSEYMGKSIYNYSTGTSIYYSY